MAISNLVTKTKPQYDALSTFYELSKSGTPDSRVLNIELKGWESSTVLVFKVYVRHGTDYEITVAPTPDNSPDPRTLNIAVSNNPNIMASRYVFYTVAVGSANGSGSDWTITFDIKANNQSTGKWIFKKGGTGDPNF